MIPASNLDLDQTDQDAPLDPRLLTDLQMAYRRSPSLDAVDGAIQRAVEAHLTQPAAWERRVRRPWLLPHLSVPVAALAVLVFGLSTYLHGQSPTPVSAQTVLHRAAAAGPGPNETTHAIYRVSSSDGSTGTADVWIGYDESGAAAQLALSLTMSQNGHPDPYLNVRLVRPGLLQVYQPAGDSTQTPPSPAQAAQLVPPPMMGRAPTPAQALNGMVVGTLLAQKLSDQPGAHRLQQETLDGVPVYALQPAGGNVTYYFNAQSYVLEGADWVQDGSSWQTRLDPASFRTMPLSAVPANTFLDVRPGDPSTWGIWEEGLPSRQQP
jgi:hypothetical protein